MLCIVIEKARSKEETLPSVRLFRSELDEVIRLFKQYCESEILSDDQYVYDGFQELREKLGPRVRRFQIVGQKPSVTLTFDSFAIKLKVEYQDGGNTVAENKRADHLFLGLREYLAKHKTLVAGLVTDTAIFISSVLAVLLIAIPVVTSPRPPNIDPNALYLDFKHGLFLAGGLVVLTLTVVFGVRRTGHHFIYYGESSDITPLWKHKTDNLGSALVLAVFAAILGIIGTLLVQHFRK